MFARERVLREPVWNTVSTVMRKTDILFSLVDRGLNTNVVAKLR